MCDLEGVNDFSARFPWHNLNEETLNKTRNQRRGLRKANLGLISSRIGKDTAIDFSQGMKMSA